MPVPYDEIRWIKDTLVRIEARVMKLEKSHDRSLASQLQHIESVHKAFSLHDGEIIDIYQRVINLEAALFPNLSRDLENLDKVLGPGDQKTYNTLDSRFFSKEPPKKA